MKNGVKYMANIDAPLRGEYSINKRKCEVTA